MTSETLDLLYGMPAIAAHLGLKVPQARHLANKGTIPTFKVGRLTCARRSALRAWLGTCAAPEKSGAA